MNLKSNNVETSINHSIAVVIPVYNEERLIKKVIQTIPPWIQAIIVVDDASTDASLSEISEITDSRLIIINHEGNRGVGASILSGYKKALELNCKIIVVMAGDAQMDPDDLPRLIKPIVEYKADYVKGNRFMHTDTAKSMPFNRQVGNHLFSLMTRWALQNYDISDSQCGFTAVSAETLRKIDLNRIYPRYGFPNDMLFHVASANCRISESRVRAIYGVEKSGINLFTTIPRMIFLLFRLALNQRIANPYSSIAKNQTVEIKPDNMR